MSLIEQAAKRLEQLRQAGVDVPECSSDPLSDAAVPSITEESVQKCDDILEQGGSSGLCGQESNLQLRPTARVSKQVSINQQALAAAGLLVPQATRNQLADEYRVIKRPLIANAMGKGIAPVKGGNLIMVTSALPGEGKTFTAINLAISIAMELDNTVMLVDADVARPSVLNMLGLPPAPGLLDVVDKNSVDISNVLLRTNIEKLSILPSGTQHSRATELLASDAMINLLDDMSSRYSDRIIIFDSPPLLLTTEARTLATHMGQIVIVVNAEHTQQVAVKEAVEKIEGCAVRLMVLNQARTASSESYGYGYGYGYGDRNDT